MFKYSKKVHIDKLVNKGIIRIGTLHEYRSGEYEEGIQDNQEGLKEVNVSVKRLDLASRDPATQRILKKFLGGQIFGEGVIIMNEESNSPMFTKNISSDNHLIFCASFEHTPLVPETFKYDGALTITHPNEFIRLISNKLKQTHNAKLVFFDKVKYQTKVEEWNHINYGYDPMYFKDESFSYQNEIRAIWSVPNNKDLSPQILRIPELREYCKLFELN